MARELKNRFGIQAEILDAKGVYDKLKTALQEGPNVIFCHYRRYAGLRPHKGREEKIKTNADQHHISLNF